MSMMTFEIIPDDGDPYRLEAGSRDVLMWEKAGKGRSFGQFGSGESMRMEHLYGLAYYAARRQGLFTGSLAEWEQSVELRPVKDDEDDEEGTVDPTRPAPGDGSLSHSPSPPASRPRSGPRKEKQQ